MYKIILDDNSFIIADENYKLTLFRFRFKKVVTIKDYLITNRYSKHHLVDCIDGKRMKRNFTIKETSNEENYPIGSRIKLAQDIQFGDLVIGKDGEPRRVKELHTGEDEMFEITIDGASYRVNGGHILALVDKDTGEHLEMPVNIYMHMNDEFRSHYVMEKVMED